MACSPWDFRSANAGMYHRAAWNCRHLLAHVPRFSWLLLPKFSASAEISASENYPRYTQFGELRSHFRSFPDAAATTKSELAEIAI